MVLQIVSRVVKRKDINGADLIYVVQQKYWEEGWFEWVDVADYTSLSAAKQHKEMMYKHHDMVVG